MQKSSGSVPINKRLMKELKDLQENKCVDGVTNIEPNEQNMNEWSALMVPAEPPFNKGAFKIAINFPAEYPFKPPKVTFKTNIYHPNVDDKGQVCLPIISPENWKPATKTEQVLRSLLKMIHEPEPDHPLRGDLADEYTTNRKTFFKNAEEHTKRNAAKRPSD